MSIKMAKLNKEEVVEVYTQTAPIYDLWGALTETKARKMAMAAADIQNGTAILEVAVGTGLTFAEILKANPDGENYGLDLTLAMLDKAKARVAKMGVQNYQLALGDAYALEFPDQRFDMLVNNYMFDLLPEADFAVVLAEFKRVLKPGGRLVLVNMTQGERFYQRFWEGVYQINPKLLGGCRGVLLAEPLQAVGFTDLQRQMVSQFGFPSEVIVATLNI